MYQKAHIYFLCLFTLLLMMNSSPFSVTFAQKEPALIIEIYDSNNWNESTDNVFFEGRTYDIIVSSENITVVLGVNISILDKIYTTSVVEPFITVLAPRFNNSQSFLITATKEGYLTAEVVITVMKGQLFVIADQSIIEEKKEFQVTVRDQDNKPIENAFVYVTSEANPVLTDSQGIAYLDAPHVQGVTTATIQVVKNGYFPGSTNIRIVATEGLAFNFFSASQILQILPIIIAFFVVIFAIIYVLWRQKRTPIVTHQTTQVRTTKISNTSQQEKERLQFQNKQALYSKKEKQSVSISTPLSKIEEIRIPIQGKKKETTILSREKESTSLLESKNNEQDAWFRGQNYMRYKLDELTGKIDKKTNGKWFEGEYDIEYKIDETLRKNLKKKKSDKEKDE